jgi:hypothetical protein
MRSKSYKKKKVALMTEYIVYESYINATGCSSTIFSLYINVKGAVFWHLMLCSLVDVQQQFGGTC